MIPPPDELVELWVAKHGAIFHFHFAFPGFEELFFFRPLTRREFRAATLLEDVTQKQEEIAKTCILWPENWECDPQGPAGIPSTLSNQILEASGFGDTSQKTFEALHARITTDLESQMEAIIEFAFGGGGDFDKYLNWSNTKLYDSYVKAQYALESTNKGVPSIVDIGGKEVNLNELTPEQRQQALKQYRASQAKTPNSSEDIKAVGAAVDAFGHGSPGNMSMGEFMQKNRKFQAMRSFRSKKDQ